MPEPQCPVLRSPNILLEQILLNQPIIVKNLIKETIFTKLDACSGHIRAKEIVLLIISSEEKKEAAAGYVYEYLLTHLYEPQKRSRGASSYNIVTFSDWWTKNSWRDYKEKLRSKINEELSWHKDYISSKTIIDLIYSLNHDKDELAGFVHDYLIRDSYLPKYKSRATKIYTIVTTLDWYLCKPSTLKKKSNNSSNSQYGLDRLFLGHDTP